MTKTYPADEWLRDITYLDAQPDDGERVPVHVAHSILLNGRRVPADELRIGRDGTYVSAGYDGGALDATLVSFTVHDEHVQHPILPGEKPDPDRPGPMLGPFKVLCPPGNMRSWEPFEIGGEKWWRVYVYVANVTFGCAPAEAKPEDREQVAVS